MLDVEFAVIVSLESVAVPVPLFSSPPPYVAVFPESVEFDNVNVPELSIPPPKPTVTLPLVIVTPEMLAVTLAFTVITVKFDDDPPPEIVKAAEGPVIVVGVEVLLRTNPLPSVIVLAELNTVGSNSMTLPLGFEVLASANPMQYRRSPDVAVEGSLRLSPVLVTV